MALRRARRRNRASITSLIDVIFLLLLFFMLASRFTQYSEIELKTAGAVGGSDNQSVEIELHVRIAPNGLFLNDIAISDDELLSNLRDQLRVRDSSIRITAAKDVSTQRLIDILILLNRLDGASLLIEASP